MELVLRYREALDWIHGLGRFGINPGLERVSALLHLLDNPHHKVCFVHIAGTNGKGSTAAMLASILRASGYCTGLYTSPYLLSFTNRMAVNGSDVAREDLVELVDLVRPLVERIGAEGRLGQPTEFEVVTVLAMLYFARRQVDLVVLETGLGGRLDATNVVNPLVSIITNVSLDHMEVLGDTVEAIAGEKAGIIKRGIPLLTASDDQRVLEVIQSRCLQMGAAFYRVISSPKACLTKTFGNPAYALQSVAEHGQEFAYCGFQWQKHNLFIPLRGVYQVSNAATALAAAELLAEKGFEFTDARVRQGLAETNWPGRLELLWQKPMLIVDGAHNPAAVELLSAAVPEYFKYQRLILVLGILADKDILAMLEHILPLADFVIFTRPALPRAADPQDIAAMAVNQLGYRGQYLVIDDIGPALETALDNACPEDAVLVTGSLYTVSDARAYWQQVMQCS